MAGERAVQTAPLSDLIAEKPRNGLYKPSEFAGRGNRWIKMRDLYGNQLITSQSMERIEVDAEEEQKFGCREGDLLFGRTSVVADGVGTCALVGQVPDTPIFESNLFRVRLNRNTAEPRFYFYFFRSPVGRFLISTIARQTAATQITSSDLIALEVPYPPLPQQKAIAHILGTLDDKIELNRRMNETLERMARALFKSWFVDFDPVRAKMDGRPVPGLDAATAALFPDGFQHVNGELVPRGWSSCELSEFGRITTGKTPSTTTEGNFGSDVPFLTPSDMDARIVIATTSRFLTEQGVQTVRSAHVPAGAIAVSCIGSDMGKAVITGRDLVTNQQINSITVSDTSHREYLFFNLRRRKDEIRNLGSGGSALPILNKGAFSRLEVLLPSEAVLMAYHRIIAPMITSISRNTREMQVLAAVRDALLPDLLSGKILSVEFAEKIEGAR